MRTASVGWAKARCSIARVGKIVHAPHSPAKTGVNALMAHAATVPRTILPTLQLCCASRGRRRHIPKDLCRLAMLHGQALTVHRRAGQRMNSKNISTDSFARAGPRASATSTDRPLPQPKTKARQRSRRQGRRRVELGSNAACCPCSFPIVRSGAGPRQLTCLFNHLVGADGSVVGTAEQFFTPRARCPCSAPRSHRRRDTIPTDPPRAALQRSVGLFGGQDEDFCSRLEIGLVARHVGDNGRIGGNKDFLFSVLVFQR